MCTNNGARVSPTSLRPGWVGLYVRAGMLLGALLLAQALVAGGAERTALECGLVGGGFAAMAQWTRRNRAALDHLDWCDCASSQVTMRVIPSSRAEPVRARHVRWEAGEIEPAETIPEEVAP